MLTIYDSLTRKKVPFKTIHPGKVGLYVCGVTVYDFCHIGHARTYATFDLLVRYLRYQGYEVTYVRNITDIDDKIIKRALEQGMSWQELVASMVSEMYQDFDALGYLRPDCEPRATDNLPEMLAMIQVLIQKKFAYLAANGDVYYRVKAFANYGALSGQSLDNLRAGERVAVNIDKEDPLDFVLWKAAKPHEPSWESPWGPGRPGWHIECSCMTKKVLGTHFDIHGGGTDLKFPHHENEIAQSEAANSRHYVNYWMHSGMVNINAEKMSKSLGNFFIIRDVLKNYSAEVVRYFLTCGHYRSEINYSESNLEQAKSALTRLYLVLREFENEVLPVHYDQVAITKFCACMDDDLNTPGALSVLFEIAHEAQRLKQTDFARAKILVATLKELGQVLGLLRQMPSQFLQGHIVLDTQKVEMLIAQRNEARAKKAWAHADALRAELLTMGVVIEDTVDGTVWRVA